MRVTMCDGDHFFRPVILPIIKKEAFTGPSIKEAFNAIRNIGIEIDNQKTVLQ